MNFIQRIFNDSNVKNSSFLDELKKSILVETEEEYNRRMNICKSCEKLKENFCTECYCYMPAKCALKNNSCVLNKHI